MKITTYILAVRDSKTGLFQVAAPLPSTTDKPVCFTQNYANYLFEFAEQLIECQLQQEILLLKGDADIEDIQHDSQFVEKFLDRISQSSGMIQDWEVLRKKESCCRLSDEFRERVMQDLRQTQEKIRQQRFNHSVLLA